MTDQNQYLGNPNLKEPMCCRVYKRTDRGISKMYG